MPSLEVDGGEAVLSPRSVRRAARYGLYRALNVRRMVGFIGSGVSGAYGRLSWNELVDEIWEHTRARFESLENVLDEHSAAKEIFETLEVLNDQRAGANETSSNDTAEHNMLVLELCERLEWELDDADPMQEREQVRSLVKRLVLDDRSYARRNFEERITPLKDLLSLSAVKNDDALKDYLTALWTPGAEPETPEHFSHRLFYNADLLRGLRNFIGEEKRAWLETSLVEALIAECEGTQAPNRKPVVGKQGFESLYFKATGSERSSKAGDEALINALPPDRRSFLAVILAAASVSLDGRSSKTAGKKALTKVLVKAMSYREQEESRLSRPSHSDRKNLLEFTRPIIDPIHTVFSALQLRRFLTTNYDLELERYLEHNDYLLGAFTDGPDGDLDSEAAGAQSHLGATEPQHLMMGRRSRVGKYARSSVFDPTAASELVEFAVGAPGVHVDIFHLHGRAQKADPLVVTERDYQATYLKNDESRRIFNEALDVIFGGNSVLFMGAGLSEADLMRPLRQFVSNRKGPADRPVFALVPALKGRTERDVELLRYKLRYGVQAIHHGCRPYSGHSDDEEERDLYKRYHPLFQSIRDEASEASEALDCKSIDPDDLSELHHELNALKSLADALEPITAADFSEENRKERVKAVRSRLKDLFAKEFQFGEVGEGFDLGDSKSGLEIERLNKVFEDIKATPRKMATLLQEYWPWMLIALPRVTRLRVDRVALVYILHRLRMEANRSDKPDGNGAGDYLTPLRCRLLSDFIKRLREKIISLSLDHEVAYIGACWQEWWGKWRRVPKGRLPELYAREGKLKSLRQRPGKGAAEKKAKAVDVHDSYRHVLRHVKIGPETRYGIDPTKGRIFMSDLARARRLDPFYDKWNHEVRKLLTAQPAETASRVAFMCQAPLGGGKGIFFEQLRLFPEWRGLNVGKKHAPSTPRHGRVFFANTTFACEYTSIIEGVIEFLGACTESLKVRLRDDEEGERHGKPSRIDRLRKTLRECAAAAKHPDVDGRTRFAIVINNVDMLFDERLEPFTGEIRAFLKVILTEVEDAPVDVILLARKGCIDLERIITPDTKVELHFHDIEPVPFAVEPVENEPERGQPGIWSAYKQAFAKNKKRLRLSGSGAASDFRKLTEPSRGENDLPAAEMATQDLLKAIYRATDCCLFTQSLILAASMETKVDAAGLRRWYEELYHVVTIKEPDRAIDEIIDRVVDCYTFEEQDRDHPQRRAKNALDNLILRHLAFFNVPVSPEVLLKCPKIDELYHTYERGWDGPGGEGAAKRRKPDHLSSLITESLQRMLRRGLVMKIHGRQESEASNEDRFVIHRRMRAYVLKRLGSPRNVVSEAHFFDMSTFVGQPRDIPDIDAEPFLFLDNLVETLSEPDGTRAPSLNTMSSMMRAALGVVRSSFSIAVLARLGELDGVSSSRREPILTEHVTRLRRLLTQADEWADRLERRRKRPGDAPAPFYDDEIIWLLNERGLTFLAQGRLYDAFPLLRRAREKNREVEGRGGNSAAARIALNIAHAQIELGALERARTTLEGIERVERDRLKEFAASRSGRNAAGGELEASHIYQSARGYRGVVDALNARSERARRTLASAIEALSAENRSRGVALFASALANLEIGEGRLEAASGHIERAIAASEAARHADLKHECRVLESRLLFADGAPGSELMARLERALDFARQVGLHGLESRACTVYGSILLSAGDSKLSGEFAVRALALAADHGMTIKQIDAMVLMSAVTLARGRRDHGSALLEFTTRMASRYGYQVAVEKAQRIALLAQESPKVDFGEADRSKFLV